MYMKKKAKDMQNSDSCRKSMIFLKKDKNLNFFDFFLFLFFQKQLYWGQTDTELNKVMNFGDSSHKTVEIPDCFLSLGQKMDHPSWNRATMQKIKKPGSLNRQLQETVNFAFTKPFCFFSQNSPFQGISPFFRRFASCISSRIICSIMAVKHDGNLPKKGEMP